VRSSALRPVGYVAVTNADAADTAIDASLRK